MQALAQYFQFNRICPVVLLYRSFLLYTLSRSSILSAIELYLLNEHHCFQHLISQKQLLWEHLLNTEDSADDTHIMCFTHKFVSAVFSLHNFSIDFANCKSIAPNPVRAFTTLLSPVFWIVWTGSWTATFSPDTEGIGNNIPPTRIAP